MSKVEPPVEDAKKLAQRCKALEAQLRQTITKKEHHEIVLEFEDKITGMERTFSNQDRKIAEQEKDLSRTKAELQRNAGLGKQIADLGAQLASLAKTVEAQGKTTEALLFKVSQGTVPAAVHQQTLSKVKEMEEQLGGMVSKTDFTSLQRNYEEANRRLNGTVPASEYDVLKGRVQDLENAISSMVPRELLEASETTVEELRARLAERVPQSTYDELISKVVQLAEEVTGGQPPVEEPEQDLRAEQTESEQPSPAEPKPTSQPEILAAIIPSRTEEAPPAPSPAAMTATTESPEIREVGTQLAELKAEALDEAKPDTDAPVDASAQKPEKKAELTFVVVDSSDTASQAS